MIQQFNNQTELLGDDLKKTLMPDSRLKIAASYFSIYAYEALKEELEGIEELQFLFTSPTFLSEQELGTKFNKERREFYIPKLGRERSLYGTEFEIALKNKLTQKAIAKECAEWIRQKVTFKSISSKHETQGVIHIQIPEDSYVYMPIKGFTASDLGYQKNNRTEIVMRLSEATGKTQEFLDNFNQFWQDPEKCKDVTDIICESIEAVYQENAPERIYFVILYNIFYEYLQDLDEGFMPNDETGFRETKVWQKLFDFQHDAAISIINKLDTYNGCILADSVGLGKTFTALAVIKYYELRNRSVLVLCPKRLSDNWLEFTQNIRNNPLYEDRFRYDVLTHTDLDRTSGKTMTGIPLSQFNWGSYDLVVIDESHNFRNNELNPDRETRYAKLMRKVIKEGVQTKVLMLSATPVNNRFLDLRNQLALAYEGESHRLSEKLPVTKSIEGIFKEAQTAFNAWSKLPLVERTAERILNMLDLDFFTLLDSVTIARSRKHIQKYYDVSKIGAFPERRKPISFHEPIVKESVDRARVLTFSEVFQTLQSLQLSVYQPLKFVYPSRLAKYEEALGKSSGKGQRFKHIDREKALVNLMTTNLLKRLESSVYAFRLTLQALKEKHDATLAAIVDFRASMGKQVSIVSGVDQFSEHNDEDILPGGETLAEEGIEVGKRGRIALLDMDIDSWERELIGDREQIQLLLSFFDEITPERDNKLQHLIKHIQKKVNNPINPGNRKVIVFSAFADTAEYLYTHLAPFFKEQYQLESAVVTGGGSNPQTTLKLNGRSPNFQDTLILFSPISKGKANIYPDVDAEIDLLIATDCISEGQNLQDCDYLINFDIHWNPVRIIQRFGRIDRIGSQNSEIQLVNYWPDIDLDEYINLKERVEGRMIITDMTATGDDNLLSDEAHEASYRKEQLKRLQTEVIDLEDTNTGVSIMDLGLNEYRLDLLHLQEKYGDPKNMPQGLHAVVPSQPELGLMPGIIFALKNINNPIEHDRKNRIHPYYLIYIGNDGEVILDQFKVKDIFERLRASTAGLDKPLTEVCKIFNNITQDGLKMDYCSELLNKSIQSMVESNIEKDIDSLFSGGETTALINEVKGLDDFELLAFLVIQA